MEQPQYNLLHRMRVEFEYARLYDDIGLGLTIWSPLASGVLTGKYLDGMPDGSRAKLPGYEWLQGMLTDPKTNEKVRKLKVVADDLGCTLAQLSLAWCTKNPHVSTVITGASRGVAGAREHGRARRRRRASTATSWRASKRRSRSRRSRSAAIRVRTIQICMRPLSPGRFGRARLDAVERVAEPLAGSRRCATFASSQTMIIRSMPASASPASVSARAALVA